MRSAIASTALARNPRRRRLLDHFLVAPLRRAVALEEMHGVAVPVAEHLELDVARPFEQALEIHLGVAEAAARHRARALDHVEQLRFVLRGSMPMPPPPPAGFTSTGKADRARRGEDRFGSAGSTSEPFDIGMPYSRGELARPRLVAHRVDPLRRRADEARAARRSRAARTRRSRKESRSPDAGRRRPTSSAPRAACPGRDSSRARAPARSRRSRSPSRDTARRRRLRNTPRPRRCPSRQRAQHARGDCAAVGDDDFVEHALALFGIRKSSHKRHGLRVTLFGLGLTTRWGETPISRFGGLLPIV